MAWSAQLHPRAPVGTSAGGQFAAGSSSSSAKAAPAKTTTAKPAAKKTTAPNEAAAKKAQALAKSVPFAELKKLTTIANNGGKLTPAQTAIVNAGKMAHADHVNHLKQPAAKPKTAAKPAAKKTTAAKKAAPKKTTTAKPTTAAQKKANAAAFHL